MKVCVVVDFGPPKFRCVCESVCALVLTASIYGFWHWCLWLTGTCHCGSCMCNNPDGKGMISGRYCECDDSECLDEDSGEVCGGMTTAEWLLLLRSVCSDPFVWNLLHYITKNDNDWMISVHKWCWKFSQNILPNCSVFVLLLLVYYHTENNSDI